MLVAEGVALEDAAVLGVVGKAVQHQVHQRQAVGVLHQLHAVEGCLEVFFLLFFGPVVHVFMRLDVMVGSNQKAACACGGVLNHVGAFGLHDGHHRVN